MSTERTKLAYYRGKEFEYIIIPESLEQEYAEKGFTKVRNLTDFENRILDNWTGE